MELLMPKKLGEKRINYELIKIVRNYKNLTIIFNSEKLTREQYMFLLDSLKSYGDVVYPRSDMIAAIMSNKLFDEEAYQKLSSFLFHIYLKHETDRNYFSIRRTYTYSCHLYESIFRLFLHSEWQQLHISDQQIKHFSLRMIRESDLHDVSLIRNKLIKSAQNRFSPRKINVIKNTIDMIDRISNQTKQQMPLLLLSKEKGLRTLASIKLGDKAS